MGAKFQSMKKCFKDQKEEIIDISELTKVVYGLVFGLNEFGPTLIYQYEKNTLTELDIVKIGGYFYPAIGQGSNRNQGLYKLPVPGYPELNAFVYAYNVIDPDYTDPRCPGQNYCLVVVIFPKWVREFIPHPSELEKIFKETFAEFKEIKDLKSSKLFRNLISKLLIQEN
ncbi:MAG: hypothetical protein ACFFD4_30565 [Candidatus Odinarchaeota archaeon]